MRLIEYLEDKTRAIAMRLSELQREGYEEDDLGSAARDAAAVWERCLKAGNPTWNARHTSLNDMSEELLGAGWGASPDLHVVRRAANADKHDATASHDLHALLNSVENLVNAAPGLVAYVSGITQQLPDRLRRRRMVCAVYDHFATGETEYLFMVADPTSTWMSGRTLDSFQVDYHASESLESVLAALDGWTVNPEEFADLKTSLRESDNELNFVASFTATYQDVLDLMAPKQHDFPLLGGLHREDHEHNLVASVVADVIRGRSTTTLTGRSSARTSDVRSRVRALLGGLPIAVESLRLDRCGVEVFERESATALAVDTEMGIVVSDGGVVFVSE
jgi:hypothetical protein